MRDRSPRPAGPPPDEAALREAALAHLARFGTTEAGLLRVLERRIDRWRRRAAAEAGEEPEPAAWQAAREAARRVAGALAGSGAVDDAAFAGARARRLSRAGRSRKAVAAHLVAKGVAPGLARTVLADAAGGEAELAAAAVQARRRRIGPFRRAGVAADGTRELAALARAGFDGATARAVLALEPEAAEALIRRLRHDVAGGG